MPIFMILQLQFPVVKNLFFSLLLREKTHKQQSKLNTVSLTIHNKATLNVKPILLTFSFAVHIYFTEQ